ncbi:hypothetical protein ODZ83_03320 [Acaricomes phytoseiuli]|uniref:hypothetical protein n=1 Tax=Acaricomes phytoseiuli TaxID=291968 RepID=UPI002221DCAB|nr:hypothetical protein [Acaricomes phytoseiuli]MCW1249229.1 hypothetical protein [Acaricomes phytoseiuli]
MTNSSDYPFDGTRSAQVVRTDFYDTIQDTVDLSGASFSEWDRADPRKVGRTTCSASPDVQGQLFSISLDGGVVSDPVGVADAVQEEWKSRGWQLGPRFDDLDVPNPAVQVSVTSATGIDVVFVASVAVSAIEVRSDCTADPAASVRPTPSG